jgi:aminopeptidase N
MHVRRTGAIAIALTASLAVTALAVPAVAGTSVPAKPSPGAVGAGDPYFPTQGNGGYDVGHYGLELRYQAKTQHLSGVARITATTTKGLSRFDLDLRNNLRVSSVLIDGRPAAFTQPAAQPTELVIIPKQALAQGRRFTAVVTYAGTPKPVTDPDGSTDGWVPTADGAVVVGEPQGAPTWFPCNDTPRDKATYDIAISVPTGNVGLSNGTLTSVTKAGGWTRWAWSMHEQMATYLVTATNGRYDLTTGRTAKGVPYINAVAPKLKAASAPVLAQLPAMIDYFASRYGPYPYKSAGAIVADLPSLGYALEVQTRPVFSEAPDDLTLAHELAHQWYGDGVTLKRWQDIWINEGFAEFSSWLWSEHTGQHTAAQYFADFYQVPASDTGFWNPPPGNPGSGADIFSTSVYERGAMTLQALRAKLGDKTFFAVMRAWFQASNGGNATSYDFTKLASRVSGVDLGHFFDVWLYRPGKPTGW